MPRRFLRTAATLIPAVKRLVAQRDALAAECDRLRAELECYAAESRFAPPGHFYSPIPNVNKVYQDGARIFDRSLRRLGGIDLNVEGQLAVLEQIKTFYPEMPFTDGPKEGLRYFLDNDAYSYGDAMLMV